MAEEIYDRVTQVISPFTGIEFVPEHVLKPAADRGNLVHKYIEGMLKGWCFEVKQDEVKPYLNSFSLFWQKSKHMFEGGEMFREKRLYCEEMRITGKMDVIIVHENRTYVIDWKTSSRPHASWALQGAAYRHLLEVNGYKNVDAVLFVRLKKDGKKPSLHKHEDYKKDLTIFMECLKLYRHFDMKNTRKKWDLKL